MHTLPFPKKNTTSGTRAPAAQSQEFPVIPCNRKNEYFAVAYNIIRLTSVLQPSFLGALAEHTKLLIMLIKNIAIPSLYFSSYIYALKMQESKITIAA